MILFRGGSFFVEIIKIFKILFNSVVDSVVTSQSKPVSVLAPDSVFTLLYIERI